MLSKSIFFITFLFGVLSVCSGLSTSGSRLKRDMTIGELFQSILNSVLGDATNKTVNETTASSTYNWLSSKMTNGGPTGTATSLAPQVTTVSDVTGTTADQKINITGTSMPIDENVDTRCAAENYFYQICDFGIPQLLSDMTIWDVYSVLFSNDVIEALLLNCDSGNWCLHDEFDYWNGLMMEKATMIDASEVFDKICLASSMDCLDDFLNNVTGCPIQNRMNFTVENIKLICEMRKTTSGSIADLQCYGHLLAMFHVTVVEFLRDSGDKDIRKGIFEGSCDSPEDLMTKSFLCLEHVCPNSKALLERFTPWQWFIPKITQIQQECNLPMNTCDGNYMFGKSSVTTETPSLSLSTGTTTPFAPPNGAALSGVENENDEETTGSILSKMTMVLGVSAGVIIAISGCFVLVYSCWRKHDVLRIDKVEYQPLRNED